MSALSESMLKKERDTKGFNVPKAPGLPGEANLRQAGLTREHLEGINTGFNPAEEARYGLGQAAIRGAPYQGDILSDIDAMRGRAAGAQQGIADYFDERRGTFGAQEQAAQTGLTGARGTQADMLAQLQGLRDAPGVAQSGRAGDIVEQQLGRTGLNLSPEIQADIDRMAAIEKQRAEGDVMRGFGTQESKMQALLAARGLGGSSVGTRGTADLMGEKLRQMQQANLAAESQGLQREMQMRGLGLQERGQTIQGGLGLGTSALQPAQFQAGLAGQGLQAGLHQQGLEQSGLSDLASRIAGVGAPAQLQAQQGAQAGPLDLMQRFRGQRMGEEQQAIGHALGAPVNQEPGALAYVGAGTEAIGNLAPWNWG